MIVEGRIVNHDGETYGQIEINPNSGLIEQVRSRLGSSDIKTSGLIFPGFVDVHIHAREDASSEQNYKEDYRTASEAAINGGVVHIADMPNNPVPPVDEESFNQKQSLSKKSLVDVTLYAAIGPQTRPLLKPVPYKVYMAKSVGEIFFESQQQLEETIQKYQGGNISFHCEDPEILKQDPSAGPEAEISAIDFALELIKKCKLAGKICHLSTKQGLAMVDQAKKEGLPVTCEVTPHHLYFDNQNFRINPPLRTRDDREALLEGLRKGQIDMLASDHAPHTIAEKQQGISGLPHLDTYGPFVTWLIKEQDFTPSDVAWVSCYNPGNFVNQFSQNKFGQIKEGFAGSLTLIDMDKPITITKQKLKTKCGWSPFEGMTFPGSVIYTIVRGKVYQI